MEALMGLSPSPTRHQRWQPFAIKSSTLWIFHDAENVLVDIIECFLSGIRLEVMTEKGNDVYWQNKEQRTTAYFRKFP